jgi:RNA polymerase sigma-70 factor, ECF subfamily
VRKLFDSSGEKTDEQLMLEIAEGSSRALASLYHRYNSRMLRYFFRMLWKDQNRAQDFLQDLFLKIIENPRAFSAERKFSTWVFSVANNMCKNEYRKQAFRKSINQNEFKDAIPLSAFTPESGDGFKEALDEAVMNLDEDDKNLYTLRYEVEMSLEEISIMLQCPVGTVKSKLFYLKKKLAEQLTIWNSEKIKYGY